MEAAFFGTRNNNETQRQEMVYKETEPYIEVPTRTEVFEVINDLNTYRAREEESNCAELLKYGRLGLWQEMQALIEVIWISKIMLENQYTAIIHQIHKNCDKLYWDSYRATSNVKL